MSYKDLTNARLCEIKRNLKFLLEDMEDLTRHTVSSSFQSDNFSSLNKHLDSLDAQLARPSDFFSYRYFDNFVEIRRCGKSDVYGVLIHGFELSKSFYSLSIFQEFPPDISTTFNEVFISGFTFEQSKTIFVVTMRYLLSETDFVQGVLNGVL